MNALLIALIVLIFLSSASLAGGVYGTVKTVKKLKEAEGPKGPQGPKGNVGDPGETGEVGPAGKDGPIGATGPQGPTGAIGKVGPQGAPGVYVTQPYSPPSPTAPPGILFIGQLVAPASSTSSSVTFTQQVPIPRGVATFVITLDGDAVGSAIVTVAFNKYTAASGTLQLPLGSATTWTLGDVTIATTGLLTLSVISTTAFKNAYANVSYMSF